jgi:cbb3-type cytochrome oxidase subunit 3
MVAIKDLFGTDIGLLSVFTIVFIVVMGVYIYGYAKRHMEEDARNAKQ